MDFLLISSYSLDFRPLPLCTNPEHSISTSVPIGKDLTLTQVRTCTQQHARVTLVIRSSLYHNTTQHNNKKTYGFRISEEGLVHAVHGGEISHVREEDVDFDRVVQAGPARFEDGGQVLEDLTLFSNVSDCVE
jgi:hypothetical protein